MSKVTTISQQSEKQKIKRKSLVGWLLVLPTIMFLLFWTVYPLIYAVYVSLTNLNLSRSTMQKFIGMLNYKLLLNDVTFLSSIGQTIWLTIVSIVFELMFGYLLAKFFLNVKGIPGINVVRTIFLLPMMITPLVVGLIFSYVLNPNLGIVNYFLGELGVSTISWFGNPELALYSIIGINVWQWTPFMMILIIAGLNSIPDSLVEVAKLEGAGWWQRFTKLEIPFITHVVAIGIFMRVMENLKMFDVVYATTNGGPGSATEVLSLLAYRQSFLYYQTGYGSAIGIVILILSTILVNVLFKIIWRKETV